jgi:hypothetical protein
LATAKASWKKKTKYNSTSIEPVTSLNKMQSGLLDWRKNEWDVFHRQPINNQEIWPIRSHHFWSISQSDYRGLKRYQAALDLHLSTSGIGRNPMRPHGMRGVVCHSSNNNDECPGVTLDSRFFHIVPIF